MSNHIKIDEDFVKSLLQDAAWDKAHVSVLQETNETVEVEEAQTVEEAEEHFCPLCESQLDEELSDEAVLEHVDTIHNLLSLSEKRKVVGDLQKDDEIDVHDEAVEEEEEDAEVEETHKAKIKEKVKNLKEKWSGQKKGDDSKTKKKGKDFEGNGNGDDDDNGDPKAFGGKKGDKSKTKKGKDFEKQA